MLNFIPLLLSPFQKFSQPLDCGTNKKKTSGNLKEKINWFQSIIRLVSNTNEF